MKKLCIPTFLVCLMASLASGEVVSLDGTWRVGESVAPDAMPAAFPSKVPVPGLTHQARPAFPDVDRYETHEFVWTMKRYDVLPATASCEGLGRKRRRFSAEIRW